MRYAELVDVYAALESTSSTTEKTELLAETFSSAPSDRLEQLVRLVRGRVFADWESADLGVSTSLTREAITKATGVDGDRVEDWWREAGDLGTAAARAVRERTQQTLATTPLSVERVYGTVRGLADYSGEGSQGRRVDAVAGLLADADPEEATYLVRTVVGAMRLGVGEGTVRDGIAWAFLDRSDESAGAVERAYAVTNDLGLVARRAADGGRGALADLRLEVFRPVKPMLARTADSPDSALSDLGDGDGEVLLEIKYDGIRAKLHHRDGETRLFSRRLEDVTRQFPDVVEAVEPALEADSYVLEAELVGYDPETGDPVPFQALSRRVSREHDVAAVAAEVPVTVFVFDCVFLDGEPLLEAPLGDRLARLEAVLDPEPTAVERAHSRRASSLEAVTSFYESALEAGHEGAMVKNLEAAYRPGSRVGYQRKLKPTMEPLDLVVTRAKWSEGRKSDYLGRPYLACRDTAEGRLREVGRLHTGFSDEELAEFHALLEPHVLAVDGREADLDPAVVIEVEYEEIQTSPTYDSGYALRFPRFSRIRRDLGPEDADTFERVRSLYEDQ
jgi:DNA ligase-1